jgi:site-specific recombinase XerC
MPAWNKGQIVGQKLPLKPKEVWGIRTRLEVASNFRELALFNLAIDSKLRACDLTCIKVRDLTISGMVRSRATVIQKKTARPVQFELSEQTRRSLEDWIVRRKLLSTDFLFPSRTRANLSTRQYGRIVDRWVVSVGLDSRRYGTHSLRRTKVSQIYKKTGNLRAVQLLLGHTKLESTVRYLGIEVDDALAMSEQVEL